MFHEQTPVGTVAPAQSSQEFTVLIEQAERLSKQGRYLDAHDLVPALRAAGQIRGTLQAARILWHLGARRQADSLVLSLWRTNRQDALARLDMVRTVANRHGPYRAWSLMREHQALEHTDSEVVAEWHSLQASVLGSLRDFERAEQAHKRAMALRPDLPWLHVEWAYVCSQQDRYTDAIRHAEHALDLLPGYRAALQSLTHLYSLVGREQEALHLLTQAVSTAQSASLGIGLFELQNEMGLFEASQQTLDYCERCMPLADDDLRQWIAARRTDVNMRLGRLSEASEQARLAGGPYYEVLAERLAQPDSRPARIELNVGFVRQHFMTCAPATLAAITSYWGLTADQLSIAEEICYDGTPNHSERRWAEQQGLVTHEFTVTWDAARALIDAGVPFTLTTVATGSGHLQAVIGYDLLRQTLLIRDPFKRTYGEFVAQPLFDVHRSSGPRGMVLIPKHEAHRLQGIDLPEQERWDGYHAVMYALSKHDREAAVQACKRLNELDSDHRLSISASRAIAFYDRNDAEGLVQIERLLALCPGDANLILQKASTLRVLASRSECEEWWESAYQSVGFDPVVAVTYAQFLSDDVRQQRKVFGLVERVLTQNPVDACAWFSMGRLEWLRARRDLGADLHRIAACLQDTNEYYAETYVRACRVLRRESEGFAFLDKRVGLLGAKSSGPVTTLFAQLEAVERTDEGFALLDSALTKRPIDPDLLLFAADVHLRYGRCDVARDLLDRAEPLAKRSSWLRLQALLCRNTERPDDAVRYAQQACSQEPLNLEMRRLLASLQAQVEGRRAAAEELGRVAAAYPHHTDLHRLWLEWLPDDATDEAITILRRLLALNPHDAWACRELAIKLALNRQFDAAASEARAALVMAPRVSMSHSTLGFVSRRQGKLADARQHFREALRCSVDNDYAVSALLEIETTLAAKREALDFVRDELVKQTTTGDGLLTFHEVARQVMDADTLLAFVRYALAERPDLWHCWVVTAAQLTRMGQHDAALELLNEATERFPLLPRVYVEKANTLLMVGQRDLAREQLTLALRINPFWSMPVRMYVDSVLDEGHALERALPVLQRALYRTPDDADLRGLLGWLQWRLGSPEQALQELRKAVLVSPALRWIWDAFKRVGQESGQPDAALAAARDLTQKRPGEALGWLRVAELDPDPIAALGAVQRGLDLEPRHQPLFEKRLQLLLVLNRHDEIETALQAAPWGPQLPPHVAAFRSRSAYARGQSLEAIRNLRSVLDADPSQFELWRQLADWCDQAQHNDDYLVAAQHMVRLAPNAAISYGYRGHAYSRLGRVAEAKPDLQRALELDPSYGFAGMLLADQAIANGDLTEARRVLDIVERSGVGPLTLLRRFRIALKEQNFSEALDRASSLFASPGVHNDLCNAVLDEARQAGLTRDLMQRVPQLIATGRCARPAVSVWLRDMNPGWLPGAFYRKVSKLVREADPGHVLQQAFLLWLAKQKAGPMLNRFMRHHRPSLRSDTESWSLAGYALLELSRHKDAAAWMADWRERADAPDWALDNLAVALRELVRDAEAGAVTQRSLQLNPHNGDAWVWRAVDAACNHDHQEVEQCLGKVDESALRPYYARQVEALRVYLRAVSANESAVALATFARLRAFKQPVLNRLLRRLTTHLLDKHTHPSKRWWRRIQFATGMT